MAEIYRYDCVTSTSDVLKSLANEGADAVTIQLSEDEAMEIMPQEPTARPHKSVDIDIAVDE